MLLSVFTDFKDNEVYAFEVIQLIALLSILMISSDKKVVSKKTVVGVFFFIMSTFCLGVFGNVAHKLTLGLGIRKEKIKFVRMS